jgi:hypothetical protein
MRSGFDVDAFDHPIARQRPVQDCPDQPPNCLARDSDQKGRNQSFTDTGLWPSTADQPSRSTSLRFYRWNAAVDAGIEIVFSGNKPGNKLPAERRIVRANDLGMVGGAGFEPATSSV